MDGAESEGLEERSNRDQRVYGDDGQVQQGEPGEEDLEEGGNDGTEERSGNQTA